MQTAATTRKATPTKLRSGEWGARVQAQCQPGDAIHVTTRSGKSWTARVAKVVWSKDGISIVATESADRKPSAGSARRCESCGSTRGVHNAYDLSGIGGLACGRCDDGSLSFA